MIELIVMLTALWMVQRYVYVLYVQEGEKKDERTN